MAIVLLAALILFLAVLIVRALRFRPPQTPATAAQPEPIDQDAIADHLAQMVRIPTVSYRDASREDAEAFRAFPALLKALYPNVEGACPQQRIGERGLLYHWKGRSQASPSVFMAHYDVVPAEASLWQRPPFAGVIEDGVLWGRGALDTKCTLLAVMEAADRLIEEGFVPAQDVYLCFGGNEEIGGDGAPGLVQALQARGVHPALVLDEGGAIVEGVFPGMQRPAALVGIAEKGSMYVTLSAAGQGGHASAPPPHTLIGRLARAVTRVEGRPFPFRMAGPAGALFDTLGRHTAFPYRLLFANLWCFSPLLALVCRRMGGEMNALVRTTCAFTQMRGADAPNVMPPAASVTANLRVISGETVAGTAERLRRTIRDGAITVRVDSGTEPSGISSMEGEPWQRLAQAVGATWPDAVLSPYLMLAASDAYHYAAISEHVYRFCPMEMTKEERGLIHGNDERIPVEKLARMVQFYLRIMRAS